MKHQELIKKNISDESYYNYIHIPRRYKKKYDENNEQNIIKSKKSKRKRDCDQESNSEILYIEHQDMNPPQTKKSRTDTYDKDFGYFKTISRQMTLSDLLNTKILNTKNNEWDDNFYKELYPSDTSDQLNNTNLLVDSIDQDNFYVPTLDFKELYPTILKSDELLKIEDEFNKIFSEDDNDNNKYNNEKYDEHDKIIYIRDKEGKIVNYFVCSDNIDPLRNK